MKQNLKQLSLLLKEMSCGHDEISVNIVRGFIKKCTILSFIFFNKFLMKVFLKMAKITPIFTKGGIAYLTTTFIAF